MDSFQGEFEAVKDDVYTNPRRQAIVLKLPRDVVERLKAAGPDWQRQVNDHFRKVLAN
jgi:uncharacterized protein (DUF4415 family)